MYTVTFIYRAHSSGSESVSTKRFDTLESVSTHLQEWYNQYLEDHGWDEDDMNGKQPSVYEFSTKALECKLEKSNRVQVFGGWSTYCCLVPVELILTAEA